MADDAERMHQPESVRRVVAPNVGDARDANWDEQPEAEVIPLTRSEAEHLFGPDVGKPSRVTPMRVVAGQVCITLCSVLVCAVLSHQWLPAAVSALIGGMICWVPSAGFALHLQRRARDSAAAWMLAEGVKLGVTIALFVVVAIFYKDARWLPLLVTYVLALKVYWLALAWR